MTSFKQYIILLNFLCFTNVSIATVTKDTVQLKNKLELTFFDEKQFFSDLDWGTLHCQYTILQSYFKDSILVKVKIDKKIVESVEVKNAIEESLNFICKNFTGYTYDVYKKKLEDETMYTLVFNLTGVLELEPKLSFFVKGNKIYLIYYH